MALCKHLKKYLDSLSDDGLYYYLAARFGEFVPIWEEVSKDEYEENYGSHLNYENLIKLISSPFTYKREPHWKNVQAGILWQIEHVHDEPDYYTYHKLVGQKFILMLGSDMLDYLHNRKHNWL